MRHLFLSGLLAAFTAAQPSAFGCTYSTPDYKVGNRFSVVITDSVGKKIGNVRVVISDFDESSPSKARTILTRTTSNEGEVTFENVPVGDHYVEIEELGSVGWNSALVHVKRGGPARSIELRWPGIPVIAAQSITFKLINQDGTPARGVQLQLFRAPGDHSFGETKVLDEGFVDFRDVPPGLYMLRVIAPDSKTNQWAPDGAIAFVVQADARVLDRIAIGMTSCGLMYSPVQVDTAQQLKGPCGSIVDVMGAAIPEARLSLLKEDGAKVATMKPDREGNFKFRDAPSGKLRLFITALGFQPRDLIVDNSAGCGSLAPIRLSMLGDFSTGN